MTEKEYRSHPAISRSELWRMHESPEKFKWFKDHPPAPTESLLFGQVVHKMLLEPTTFSEQFRVLSPLIAKNRRTKEGKAKYEQYIKEAQEEGVTLIDPEMYQLAFDMVSKCRSDPSVMELLDGAHEQEFFWIDKMTGEECKCRVDVLTSVDGDVTVVDYKSTNNASTHAFVRDVYRYGYYFQSGMYGAGVQANLDLPKLPRFIFIAQEKKPPYSINRIELPEDVILLGYDKFRELIGLYHDCKESGIWPGYNGMFNDLNEAYILEWAKESDEVE